MGNWNWATQFLLRAHPHGLMAPLKGVSYPFLRIPVTSQFYLGGLWCSAVAAAACWIASLSSRVTPRDRHSSPFYRGGERESRGLRCSFKIAWPGSGKMTFEPGFLIFFLIIYFSQGSCYKKSNLLLIWSHVWIQLQKKNVRLYKQFLFESCRVD